MSQCSDFYDPISETGFSFSFFFPPLHQQHSGNERVSTAWLCVFSDVLGHCCHLLNTEVTTKQSDLSFCTSDSPLSGLASPKRSCADRVSYARKTEGLSFILCSMCPICQEHLSARG